MGRIVRLTPDEIAAMKARLREAFEVAGVPYGYCCCGCGERTGIRPDHDRGAGYVAGEPAPWKRAHYRRIDPLTSYVVEDRGYVTSCWTWQRSCNDKGYGLIYWRKKRGYAHRWFYERRHGPIGTTDLDHLCRVRNCVNPDHLQPVTHAENMQRAKPTKLTMAKAREIRRRRREGTTHLAIAREFGISKGYVWKIIEERTWKDPT